MKNQEKARKLFNLLCKLIDFDVEREAKKKTRKISLATMDIEDELTKAYNFLNTNRPELAVICLNEAADSLLNIIRFDREDIQKGLIEDRIKVLRGIGEVFDLYDSWVVEDFQVYLDTFDGHDLFNKKELNVKTVKPEIIVELDEAIQNGLLVPYIYTKGKAPLGEDFGKFQLNDNLILCDSVVDWLNYTSAQLSKDEDVAKVTFFMKIEEIIDFSYFIISISYKDHLWICTDMQDFDNPRNKATRRNPYRVREGVYGGLGFPYGIIDEMEDIRKKSKTLKPVGLDLELYLRPLKEFPTYTRVYLISAINRLFEEIKNKKPEIQLMGFGDYVDQKILTGKEGKVDYKEGGFIGFEKGNQIVVDELLETIENITSESTALAPLNKEIVVSNEFYDKDWLAPADKLRSIAKWTILDTKREDYQKKLEKLEARKDVDTRKLNRILKNNFDRLVSYIYSGERVYFQVSGFINRGDWGFWQKEKLNNEEFIYDMKYKHDPSIWSNDLWLGKDMQLYEKKWQEASKAWRGWSSFDGRQKCVCCNKTYSKAIKEVRVLHYSQLMFLVGVESRQDLPLYYQNYRAHNYIPYHGNSILDNVHPYSLLNDPCSNSKPNGISIPIYMCGYCNKKLPKNASYIFSLINIKGEYLDPSQVIKDRLKHLKQYSPEKERELRKRIKESRITMPTKQK